MRLLISVILIFAFIASTSDAIMINLNPRDNNIVLYDGVTTFKAVAKYSVFIAGVTCVLIGELKDKPNLIFLGKVWSDNINQC